MRANQRGATALHDWSWGRWMVLFIGMLTSTLSAAACDSEEIRAVRASALAAYQAKAVSDAAHQLSTFYDETCDFYTLAQSSDAVLNEGLWLISDLMLYRRKTNAILACLSLGDEVYRSWMVSEPSRHLPRAERALQTNLTQCRQTLETQFVSPPPCPLSDYDTMFALPASWRERNPLFHEVVCVALKENDRNLVGGQRDGPQTHSEGMQSYLQLEVLYVKKVTSAQTTSGDNGEWVNQYGLDVVYFSTAHESLIGGEQCYALNLKVGHETGTLLLEGGAHYCEGGTATFVHRMIATLDYPFRVRVLEQRMHAVK